MTCRELVTKRVAFVGFEATNRALWRYIHARYPDFSCVIHDQNLHAQVPNDPRVASVLGETYLNGLDSYDVVIRSPGVRYWPELRAIRHKVTTATNLFFDDVRAHTKARIIGVTGTKGKSTTTSLIHHTLKTAELAAICVGNVEVQDWDLRDQVTDDTWIVYELSSYMLEDFSGWPDVAVMVSLFPDHLDWHEGYTNYVHAKSTIVARQTEQDLLLFNAAFEELVSIARRSRAQRIAINTASGWHVQEGWFCLESRRVLPTDTLKLPGMHNKINALFPLAISTALAIPPEVIGHAFSTFQALPHRLEKVAAINAITYVDDAISTTPESTLVAVATCGEDFPPLGSIILGGLDRGYSFDVLTRELARRQVPHVVLLPGSREAIQRSLARARYQGSVHEAASMKQAVSLCATHTPSDSTCLLSTSAPSYDLFQNFKDKGNQFQIAVRALSPQKT